ncbi:MAG TPA: V-type ATP synthase subunit A [Candidatus Brocadiia bacterium]|nr:V-type ATP synthase subunit A [Candidatus Brocadiia bacterium]
MAENGQINPGAKNGIIARISGPIVDATGMRSAGMYEVVEVGSLRLVGEVIRVSGDVATIQVYEDTTGVKPGDVVLRTESPLVVRLGPGLLGSIYDGIQRPLDQIQKHSGAFIRRGEKVSPLDAEKKWLFKPLVKEGDAVGKGKPVGVVQETGSVEHRILPKPGECGTVVEIVPEGEYTVESRVARLKGESGAIYDVFMAHQWPVRNPRPILERRYADAPLITGQRVIDAFFPLARGGTAAIPGGFGTGKTMMQHALAKWSDADIIVYIGCGERGNEMTDVLTDFPKLIDPRSGRSLMERTVLVANTSNMPVAAREVSIYTGITMAEYYRDMGYDVAIMADSTSRWAEALRELAGRLEEMPAEEGFPAYLATRLAQFYERAGAVTTLGGGEGSVSIVGAVSPPGGDFSEPVTQHTRRFVRCFWALDTTLANARHYPSINWLTSYSEYAEDIRSWWEQREPSFPALREEAMEVLQLEARLQQIVKLVGPDVLPDTQRFVLIVAEIIKNGFLQQSSFDKVDTYTDPERQVFLLGLMMEFYRRGKAVIAAGSPVVRLHEMKAVRKLSVAKSTVPNGDKQAMADLRREVGEELEALEAEYQK